MGFGGFCSVLVGFGEFWWVLVKRPTVLLAGLFASKQTKKKIQWFNDLITSRQKTLTNQAVGNW